MSPTMYNNMGCGARKGLAYDKIQQMGPGAVTEKGGQSWKGAGPRVHDGKAGARRI